MSTKEKLLASAQKNLQKGQIARAVKDYQKLVEADPKDIRNRQKLAELYSRAQMSQGAIEEFKRVAEHYSSNGFYLKAIAVFKQMQKLNPGEESYYLRLAELNEKQGLVGNAQSEYRSLLAFYEKHGRYSEGVEVLQKMKALEPENLNIRVKVAESYVQGGMQDKAKEEFLEVLDLLRQKKDHSRIVKVYEIFLPLFPDDREMRGGFGHALVEKGEIGKGIQLLENLLRDQPEEVGTLRFLAQACRKQGDLEKEGRVLQQILQSSPEDTDCREAYIRNRLEGENYGEALEKLEEWQGALLGGGRQEALQRFYEELKRVLPKDQRVAALTDSRSGGQSATLAEMLSRPVAETAGSPDLVSEPATADISPGNSGTEEPPTAPIEAAKNPAALDPETVLNPLGPAEPEMELDLEIELAQEPSGLDEGVGEEDEFVELELCDEAAADEVSEVLELDEVLAGEGSSGLSDQELQIGLEEADFYLQQGLYVEAEHVCRNLLELDPGCVEARHKLTDLEARRSRPRIDKKKGKELVDFGAEIRERDLVGRAGEDMPDAAEADPFGHEIGLSESQKGVRTEIDLEDSESHYNLGIAYKEMGLLDEAVAEFDKAARNPSRRFDCLTLKGICLAEKGAFGPAEEAFKNGLAQAELTPDERLSLHYEMGLLYEAWNRSLEALDSFQCVADADLFFRDVGGKIESLRKKLGLDSESDEREPVSRGKKDKVSYV